MFSLFCPEFHTLILMSFWKKTGSMSPIPALLPSKASAVGKIQYSVEGNNGSRELALDKPVITSSLQGLSCTPRSCVTYSTWEVTLEMWGTPVPEPHCSLSAASLITPPCRITGLSASGLTRGGCTAGLTAELSS